MCSDLNVEESSRVSCDSPDIAFPITLPSEPVNDIANICIMPHLNADCMGEMEVLVCKNLFIKHYCTQLILVLESAHLCTTYEFPDALVDALSASSNFKIHVPFSLCILINY